MKTITIDVPPNGKSINFVLRDGARAGQAVVVLSDDVEIRDGPKTSERAIPRPAKTKARMTAPTPASHDHAAILKRLIKLKPTKRSAAINSIKAMFQFDAPITDDAANGILDDLAKRGHLTIDAKDKIDFRS